MPSYRAYFANATDANTAVSAAIATLNARYKSATSDASATIQSTSAVVGVVIQSVENIPKTAGLATPSTNAKVRITSPDGRSEIANAPIPTTQADTLISVASGTVTMTCTKKSQIRVKSRIAKTIQVLVVAGSATLTGLVVEDRTTGKQYTCNAYTASAAGTHNVDVTEVSSADKSDITHGSTLLFLAPPSNVVQTATVNRMLGFSVTMGAAMKDGAGRRYVVASAFTLADSGYALFGDNAGTVDVRRDETDGLDITASLAVGDTVTFSSPAPEFSATATVSQTGGVTIPTGTSIYIDVSGVRYTYTTTIDTVISDVLSGSVPFKSVILGPTANRTVGDTMTLTAAITNVASTGPVATSVAAATYPTKYASQVIGAPIEWGSKVYRSTDGRWVADVFSQPLGS